MLGDLGLGLFASLLAHVSADRSSGAAGLFFFAAGVLMLMSSLGLSRRELRLICHSRGAGNLKVMAGWGRGFRDLVNSNRKPRAAPLPANLGREPPVLGFDPAPRLLEPQSLELPGHGDQVSGGRDPAFDRLTDKTSHEIAKRFAPARLEAQRRENARTEPVLDVGMDAERSADREVAGLRPPLGLLRRADPGKAGALLTEAELRAQAGVLTDVLADFGVKGEIRGVHPGPVVTLYEFEPARGVKSARVIGLEHDLARSLGAACARAAAMPGRNAIGIEVPNARREKVLLRELLEAQAFPTSEAALPLALGKDISGTAVFADLQRMPHLLVAGTTGSGKSVGVNAMILSLLYRHSAERCRLLLIDPKMLELSVYNGIPHLLCPVVT
ncbi:MAG: DNA translocase FtsK, partial [Hyphomicrobiaceae bacterium]|nr:DNA translocase FtsK [Hyphomicrobiaceae bacterium]